MSEKIKLFYTHEDVEKITRRAIFRGELLGRNKDRQSRGEKAEFPFGKTSEEVADNFLKEEEIHNSLQAEKLFYRRDNIGKAKYTVSKHDGVQVHKDGSPFYDIATFSNKKNLHKYISDLKKEGYVERY